MKVAIIMGSTSDLSKVEPAIGILKDYGVEVNVRCLSAHLSIVQMPSGIPVATVAINGSKNAAYLALQIMAIKHDKIKEKLVAYRKEMEVQAMEANAEVIAKYK